MKIIVWIVVVALLAVGGWYWWSTQGTPAADTTPTNSLGTGGSEDQTNTGTPATPVLTVAHGATLGDYLVAQNGMTLYLYTKDTPGASNCSGQCAINWPPYTLDSGVVLAPGAGVTGELATIAREDGSMQLMYNDMPLYFWKDDMRPGDTTGQNVGGVWFVLEP